MTIQFIFELMLTAILTIGETGEEDDKWSSSGHILYKAWKLIAFTASVLFMMVVLISPILFWMYL